MRDQRSAPARIEAGDTLPEGVGEAIVRHAPARGPVEVFEPREMAITEAGNLRERRSGWLGQKALRRADAFAVMQAQCARRWKGDGAVPALFTAAQLHAGRTYGALVERHAAAGMRCSSVEASLGGGGGCYIDALVAEADRLARMREAIGPGYALDPGAAAPHRDRRRPVRVRVLVDAVCVEDRTLSDVMAAHGWARKGQTRERLRTALCAALDRLYGL